MPDSYFPFQTTVCAMGFLFVNISFQGLSLFLPTVVNSCKSLNGMKSPKFTQFGLFTVGNFSTSTRPLDHRTHFDSSRNSRGSSPVTNSALLHCGCGLGDLQLFHELVPEQSRDCHYRMYGIPSSGICNCRWYPKPPCPLCSLLLLCSWWNALRSFGTLYPFLQTSLVLTTTTHPVPHLGRG